MGEKIWCDYCHKPQHTRENCWDLHGKPPHWKPRLYIATFQDISIEEMVNSRNAESSIGVLFSVRNN